MKNKNNLELESKFVSGSAGETQAFGGEVAGKIIRNPQNKTQKDKAITLALSGELGSGKTTFLQGFAKGLGIEKRVISPTFILLRTYKIENRIKSKMHNTFIHIDLYRLEGDVKGQLKDLGFLDFAGDPNNIIAVEWAEKAKDIMPDKTIWLNFGYIKEDKRRIEVNQPSD